MVASDRGDVLIGMLCAEDADVREQGWELMGCLTARARWRIARRLLGPREAQWRLAARCLVPEPLASWRLQLFAVRCAQYRLEGLRRAGLEPREWAWRAIEAAELRAQGRLRERVYDALLRETEPYRGGGGWDDDGDAQDQTMGDDEVRLEQIPESWKDALHEPGVRLDLRGIVVQPEVAGWVGRADAWDAQVLAERAAAGCLVDPHEDEYGEPVESIPSPETLAEWRWQRHAWMAIVVRGEDGLALLYGPAGQAPSQATRRATASGGASGIRSR